MRGVFCQRLDMIDGSNLEGLSDCSLKFCLVSRTSLINLIIILYVSESQLVTLRVFLLPKSARYKARPVTPDFRLLSLPTMSTSSVIVPDDKNLLESIREVQSAQGDQIGLQKIYDYLKASHPTWAFSLKRLREVRKNHNLAPAPPLRTTSKNDISTSASPAMLRLEMKYMMQGEPEIVFMEDIPAEYCLPNAPKEVTSKFLQDLIDLREPDILAARTYHCLYCHKPAACVFGMPMVTLAAPTPSVINLAQPLCQRNTACAREAFRRIQEGLRDPHGPLTKGGVEIYNVPS